jgi:carbonic anhydrase
VSVGPPGREIPKSPWPSCEAVEREKMLAREAKS